MSTNNEHTRPMETRQLPVESSDAPEATTPLPVDATIDMTKPLSEQFHTDSPEPPTQYMPSAAQETVQESVPEPQAEAETVMLEVEEVEDAADEETAAQSQPQESAEETTPPPMNTNNDSGTVPPAGPSHVPFYSYQPPAGMPQPQRPTGASGPTIVLGAIVAAIGALTIVVGALLGTPLLSFTTLRNMGGYAFAGLGLFLSVVAIIWGISSAVAKRRNDRQ